MCESMVTKNSMERLENYKRSTSSYVWGEHGGGCVCVLCNVRGNWVGRQGLDNGHFYIPLFLGNRQL